MTESVCSPDPAPDPVAPVRTSRRDPAATRQKWAERLQRFRAAQMTVAQFCAHEGVSVPAFYASTRALRAATATDVPAAVPELVPVRVARPASAVEVVLPSGAVLRFSADCDPQHVAALLRAVGAISC